MSGNSFGRSLVVTTFGESHGKAVGCVVDGCPPGHLLELEAIQAQLDRRRPGQSKIVTQRDESDQVEVLSGVDLQSGRTLGTPICMVVRNADARSSSYESMRHTYRPSHADFTYDAKYGLRAVEGGGRASARETIGRVAAGALAEQLLHARFSALRIVAWVERVGALDAAAQIDPEIVTREVVDRTPTRVPEPAFAEQIETAILAARKQGDSLGGVIRLYICGVPPGLGSPVFEKLSAKLAQAMMSLPACKAVEIGAGFASVGYSGLSHNDALEWKPADGAPPVMTTKTNRSGGMLGGISNGMPIDLRLAFKPTATVLRPQATADDAGNNVEFRAEGRHDPCVLPRAVPIVEAMAALVLCDAWLAQRGQVGDPWPGLKGPLRGEP